LDASIGTDPPERFTWRARSHTSALCYPRESVANFVEFTFRNCPKSLTSEPNA
jgi:hypothetical protein